MPSFRPNRQPPTANRFRSKGFSLVAAIFLLVVLAMLGAFGVKMAAGQQQTVNLALLGARALSAANAGIEWGAARALGIGGTCTNGTLNLTEGALNGFTVAVTCGSTGHTEGAAAVTVYELEAIARFGTYGQPDYVSRTVRARFTDAI